MRLGLSLLLLLGCGTSPALASDCLVLTRPLAAGEFLHGGMTARTACESREPGLPLRYDRQARAPVAIDAIPSGTYLGRLKLPRERVLSAGEPLTLVFRRGPVAVEREAVLLLPARNGESAVAKTADGIVFSLPLMPSSNGGAK